MDPSQGKIAPDESVEHEEDVEAWDEGPAVVIAPQPPRVLVVPPPGTDAGEDEDEEAEEEEEEEGAAFEPTESGKAAVILASELENSVSFALAAAAATGVIDQAQEDEPEDAEWDEEGEEQEEEEGDPGEGDEGDADEANGEDKAEEPDHWSDEEQALKAHRFTPIDVAADLGLQGEEMELLAEHLRRVEEGIRFAMRSLATSDALLADPEVPHAVVVEPRPAETVGAAEGADGEAGDAIKEPEDDFFADVEPDPPTPRPSSIQVPLLTTSAPPGPPVPLSDDDEDEDEAEAEENVPIDGDDDELPPVPSIVLPSSSSSSLSALQLLESPALLHS